MAKSTISGRKFPSSAAFKGVYGRIKAGPAKPAYLALLFDF
jgi:hypothetical protein